MKKAAKDAEKLNQKKQKKVPPKGKKGASAALDITDKTLVLELMEVTAVDADGKKKVEMKRQKMKSS